jgi:hypothetical protein
METELEGERLRIAIGCRRQSRCAAKERPILTGAVLRNRELKCAYLAEILVAAAQVFIAISAT